MKTTQLIACAALAVAAIGCSNGTENNTHAANTTVASAPPAQQSAPGLKDMQWLAGTWQSKTPDGIVFERWTAASDTAYSGTSGFIKGKDTMVSESIALVQRGGDVLYIPTVKEQNQGQPVQFRLTSSVGDSFVFSNPAHDFPSTITYAKKSATEMTARISGKINGKDHAEGFTLTKVAE